MFTGIVEELGIVEGVEQQSDALRITIGALHVLADARLGDSIAVNGCCLTVAERDGGSSGDTFTADVMLETLDKTSLRGVEPGDQVNLERAVTATTRLGGHIVQGHVDGVGIVVARTPGQHWEVIKIEVPAELDRYLVDKGSVTVDGVSLTVVSAGPVSAGLVSAGPVSAGSVSAGPVSTSTATGTRSTFTVSLIPETLARTTLGRRQPGDRLNIEVDVVAKHVEKLLRSGHVDKLRRTAHDGEDA